MNAIEQMMQTLGFSAASAAGSADAGQGTGANSAAQAFASIISPTTGEADSQTISFAVAPEGADSAATIQDYIASFGSLIPALQQALNLDTAQLATDIGTEPGFTLAGADVAAAANLTDGTIAAKAGEVAVTFTNGVQPFDALLGDDIPAAEGLDGHFLPTNDLLALINGEVPESFNIIAAAQQAAAATNAQAAPATAPTAPVIPAPVGEVAPEGEGDPLLAPPLVDPAKAAEGKAPPTGPKDIPDEVLQGLEVLDAPVDETAGTDAAVEAKASELADKAEAEAQAVEDLIGDPAATDDAAEASAVGAQQAAANSSTKDATAQAAEKKSAASAAAQHSDSASTVETRRAVTQEASAQQADSRQSRSTDIPLPQRGDAALASGAAAARDTGFALTPERLAGMGDGSAADSIASGLSGLRGEASTTHGASLLAGRASPTFAANVAQQFNLQVGRAMVGGNQEFSIQMDPAELGKVQVRLQFTQSGEVRAQVLAERPETLDLLQRDTRALEKTLEANGQKLAEGGLNFGLDNGSEQSAGRAFAEALQQEKMRDQLASMSGMNSSLATSDDTVMDAIPLDQILPYVTAETGVDIRV